MTVRVDSRWQGRTGGGSFGQRFLFVLLARIPMWLSYGVLDVALPFWLIGNRCGFAATRHYFADRMGYSPFGSFREAYATHRLFGQMMFDRFAVYGGRLNRFAVEVEHREQFDMLVDHSDGFVVAGSHVGSMEMAGYMTNQQRRPINSVIYGGENGALQARRAAALAGCSVKMIPVADDMSHLFAIKAALDRGEIVSMPCDRLFGSNKSVKCNFLGAEARFPVGAFALASGLNKPVVALTAVKSARRTYRILVDRLEVSRADGESSRSYALRLAECYVGVLEQRVRQYPREWFNFYDFWS